MRKPKSKAHVAAVSKAKNKYKPQSSQ
jgi:hypothetical protein